MATATAHVRQHSRLLCRTPAGEEGVTLVNCPRSYANFLDLGQFQAQFDAARSNGLAALGGSPPQQPLATATTKTAQSAAE